VSLLCVESVRVVSVTCAAVIRASSVSRMCCKHYRYISNELQKLEPCLVWCRH